jgi:hypothetical protein
MYLLSRNDEHGGLGGWWNFQCDSFSKIKASVEMIPSRLEQWEDSIGIKAESCRVYAVCSNT